MSSPRDRFAARPIRASARTLVAALPIAFTAVAALASNGLTNPRFDLGASGWSAVDGVVSWSPAVDVDECAGSGSAQLSDPEMVSGDWTATLVSSGSCVPTVEDATLLYRIRVLALASLQHTDFAVLGYTDESCSVGETEVPIAGFGPLSPIWLHFQLGITLDPSVLSVRALMRTRDDSTSSSTYHLDSVYLGYDDPILLDDLEAGSLCRWSSVEPAPEPAAAD